MERQPPAGIMDRGRLGHATPKLVLFRNHTSDPDVAIQYEAMKAKLVLASKDRQTSQEVPFDRPTITMGRKPNNDLAFNRPEISGNHAAFLFENNDYYVTDLGSTNGTLLNGAQLVAREKYKLQDGDVITIAPYTIQFVMEVESMETMIEIPAEAIPAAAKKVGSGTKPDMGGSAKKLSTGTEESKRDDFIKEEPPPPPPPAPVEPGAAPQPAPAAAPAAPQAQAAKPAAQPMTAPAPEIASKTPSALTDYLWLGIGAILVLIAIGLVVFIFVGL
jgi:pSer/pThr/pTyr-binding forkhead associated (FHA) protein